MMKRLAIPLLVAASAFAQNARWSPEDARNWYARQPWLVGSNYIPSYAINQLEMWGADTFDPVRIDMELGWAQSLGFNTMRVFLHDQLWQQSAFNFQRRIDRFLWLADRHKIRVLFVLFDSCWDPFPEVNVRQRAPKPGVHNSGWVQSPGAKALMDPKQTDRFLEYVQQVIAAFAKDKRVLAWDLWNEPDNLNVGSYGASDPQGKAERVAALLPRVYEYARAAMPTQPLTSGVWQGDWSSPDKLSPVARLQIDLSDVISFHSYGPPEEFEKRVKWLQAYGRPILCTEYMARPLGSTFQSILPIAKKYGLAAYNWGFVNGKTQTNLPWDSWQHAYTDSEPPVWFHDVLTADGKPYRPEEADFLRQITAREAEAQPKGKKARKAAAAKP
jgi:hypothetical protein